MRGGANEICLYRNAQCVYGINVKTEPLDFTGALMRYGWADRIWWQKEVLYD